MEFDPYTTILDALAHADLNRFRIEYWLANEAAIEALRKDTRSFDRWIDGEILGIPVMHDHHNIDDAPKLRAIWEHHGAHRLSLDPRFSAP